MSKSDWDKYIVKAGDVTSKAKSAASTEWDKYIVKGGEALSNTKATVSNEWDKYKVKAGDVASKAKIIISDTWDKYKVKGKDTEKQALVKKLAGITSEPYIDPNPLRGAKQKESPLEVQSAGGSSLGEMIGRGLLGDGPKQQPILPQTRLEDGSRRDLLDTIAGVTPEQQIESATQAYLRGDADEAARSEFGAGLQQTGKDLAAIPAHYFNQKFLSAPRSLLEKISPYKYPEDTKSLAAGVTAKAAGIRGMQKNILSTQVFPRLGAANLKNVGTTGWKPTGRIAEILDFKEIKMLKKTMDKAIPILFKAKEKGDIIKGAKGFGTLIGGLTKAGLLDSRMWGGTLTGIAKGATFGYLYSPRDFTNMRARNTQAAIGGLIGGTAFLGKSVWNKYVKATTTKGRMSAAEELRATIKMRRVGAAKRLKDKNIDYTKQWKDAGGNIDIDPATGKPRSFKAMIKDLSDLHNDPKIIKKMLADSSRANPSLSGLPKNIHNEIADDMVDLYNSDLAEKNLSVGAAIDNLKKGFKDPETAKRIHSLLSREEIITATDIRKAHTVAGVIRTAMGPLLATAAVGGAAWRIARAITP